PSRAEKHAAPKKRAKLNPRNDERAAEKRVVKFGPQADACRSLPCIGCGQDATPDCPTDPHHEPQDSTDADTVPLCRACHTRRHAVGPVTFWAELGVDPEEIKQAVRDWMANPCPVSWGLSPVREAAEVAS
ncbi:hypothetical protein, partial [Longimicrobium sp.]|uniref:hypothetical protein n=1 Tax=Longimicrobium sp. TaxID=2029185 RepID=UPI002F95A651